MSAQMTPQDKQLAMVTDAIRGAISNLTVALQVIGSLRAPAVEVPKAEEGQKHFRRGAVVRPTAATEADSPQNEG